ncbi:CynX/NimT family MFS transporter [Microbacterium sp. YY-01]|uniref:CynX/NimT family MFS transporter n=1 Tax=Microbacterium sp. YY-01 TaxID=3421634 RepID=UPI003D177FE6
MSTQPAPGAVHGWRLVFLAAGLLLIGLNLRIGVASVGPVIDEIQRSLGLSPTAASLLTTIPVFAFGAFAFFTPALMRRMGMHRLLWLVAIAIAAGILLRLHPSLVALMLGTVIVGAAIAIGNVVMPPAIKHDLSEHAGLMMGLYSTALFVGAAAASGFTVPIMPVVGNDWRAALAVWAIPAVIAAIVWIPQLRRTDTATPRTPGRTPSRTRAANSYSATETAPVTVPTRVRMRSIITDPIAIAVTAHMGLQSVSYYVILTWSPTMLHDAGIDATTAGWLLSYSAFPGIAAALITPVIARRIRPLWLPVAVAAALTAVGYIGLAVAAATMPVAWMTLLGLGQGASISLALLYIVWRSPDAEHTGQLSTMAQGFGYLVAGLGPLVIAAVHDASGNWTTPMLVLGVLLIAQLVSGIIASRPVHVQPRTR